MGHGLEAITASTPPNMQAHITAWSSEGTICSGVGASSDMIKPLRAARIIVPPHGGRDKYILALFRPVSTVRGVRRTSTSLLALKFSRYNRSSIKDFRKHITQ